MKIYCFYFLIVFAYFWIAGYCQRFCPQVAELGTKHDIVGNVTASRFTYFIWNGPHKVRAATCNVSSDTCLRAESGYNASLSDNNTKSILTILTVTERHSGLWLLRDLQDASYDVCHLVTVKKPQCSIRSNKDDLDFGDELNLTLTITEAHCSESAEFSLTTGNVTTLLENITNGDVTIDFQVKIKRFGNVTLNFSCRNKNWTLSCEGVKKLIKSAPKCNISSSRSTYDLDLGDNMTLTADIRGYYCPEPAEFSLITGDVTEMFPQNSTENVTNTVIISRFIVGMERFGQVGVNYKCDGDRWMLRCDGVKELIQEGVSTTPIRTVDRVTTPVSPNSGTAPTPGLPIPIIVGAAVGGLLLIIIIAIIVLNRRKVTRVAQKYIVTKRKGPNMPNLENEIATGSTPDDVKDLKTG